MIKSVSLLCSSFTARCCARVLYAVIVSVCHKAALYQNGQTEDDTNNAI